MSIRTTIIQKLIHLNESILFYPKLKRFYTDNLNSAYPKILDVGANKGQSIDFFLSINPLCSIDAFEPNQKLFGFLEQKYSRNPQIKIYDTGVSDINGFLDFQENILDETSTFEKVNPDSGYLRKKARILGVQVENIFIDRYKVEVIKLGDFIRSKKITFIDVLKIDVEGHEFQCLQGLFRPNPGIQIKFIQLESHNDNMYLASANADKIKNILLENGFEEVVRFKHGFGDFHEVVYKNINL